MSNSGGITALKEILFEEENERYHKLSKQIKDTSKEIDDKLANREIPESEFSQILDRIVTVMPEKLGPTITSTLKTQIKESRDDVVQALFPIVGQMIKKYIQQEMQVLTERIDRQFEQAFSFDILLLRLKALMTGVSYSELALKNANQPQVREIFLIEESGILMASYSKSKSFDQDMMAGMLTAIKSFVEDAMETEQQNLEMISYDLHKIYVQNFHKFYIAVVISGAIDEAFKSKLNDQVLKFVKDIMLKSENREEKELTKKISQYFEKI
ncbi:MAG: hypothetical protein ABJG47_09080 [Ekhidna sp.]